MSKTSTRADLLKAVGDILDGKKHFRQSVRREVRSLKPSALHAALSAQEYKVLLALAAGRRIGDVASELNLSAKTVSTYKRRILNKLGLASTADLVRFVIDRKLS